MRELNNHVEAAMNYASGDTLKLSDFKKFILGNKVNAEEMSSYNNPIEEIKRQAEATLIKDVLDKFNGNKTRSAKYLKVSRPLLYQKMKRLGIKA